MLEPTDDDVDEMTSNEASMISVVLFFIISFQYIVVAQPDFVFTVFLMPCCS